VSKRNLSIENALLGERRRALSDPLRLRIREAVSFEPRTVKELGSALGVEPNRLYYHLRILEGAELIEVTGTNAEGRMTEKIYGPAGGSFGNELPGQDPVERAVFFGSILDATKSELTEVVLGQRDEQGHRASLLRSMVVGTPEEVERLWSAVHALIDEQNQRSAERVGMERVDGTSEDLRAHTLTLALYEQHE
jgi:DNA-binding transcriptional ArsR family regulator